MTSTISGEILLILVLIKGTLCQYDLSACEELFPCQNNGTCTIDTSAGSSNETFMCLCPPGFSGPQCEHDISICNTTNNICLNGGQCIDEVGVNFHCKCETGWEGLNCEIEIDKCKLLNPCQNAGICVNKLNDFSCACPFGFTGKKCEKKLKICQVNPCQNGAFCLHEDMDIKRCYCVPDFHGTLCEFQYNECDPGPKCFNGGTCIDGVGEFTCSCPPEFFGPHCQCTSENMTDPICRYNETISASTTTPGPHSTITPAFTSIADLISSSSHPPSSVLLSSLPDDTDMVSTIMSSIVLLTPTVVSEPELTLTTEGAIILDSAKPYSSSTIVFLPSSTTMPEPESTIFLEGSEGIFPSLTTSLLPTPISIFPSVSEPLIILSEEISMSQTLHASSIPETVFASEFPITTSKHDFESYSEAISSVQSLPDSKIITTATPIQVDQSAIYKSELSVSPTHIDPQSVLITSTLPPKEISTEDILTEPTISYEFSTVELDSKYPLDQSLTITPFSELSQVSLSLTTPAFSHPFSDTLQSSPIKTTPVISGDSIFIVTTPFSSVQSEAIADLTSLTSMIESTVSAIFIPGSSSDIYIDITSVSMSASSYLVEPSLIVTTPPPPASSPSPTTQPVSIFTTPEPSVTIPTNDSQTDPCHNYCYNNGKCISDSIEPLCICSFKYLGSRCEVKRKKFTTTSFSGDSFLGYKVPNDSINKISVKAKFATNAPDAILFYTSSSRGRLYALIFTQGGHITLHFSCGAQSMHFVETRTRVDNGHNFTLGFSMEMVVHDAIEMEMHCVAQVSVNHSYIMRGEQIVGNNELYENPIHMIYLGGVDNGNARKNDDLIAILPGFRGCLYNLEINDETKDLFDDAIDGKEVSECSAFGCVSNPCFGSSKCVPSNKFPFWQCICSSGFQGAKCQIRVCDSNPCKNGATCTFPVEEAYENLNSTEITQLQSPMNHTPICLCPLGFIGKNCQSATNITKPSFQPVSGFDYSAYIQYEPIPRFADWVQMKLHFVTRNISQISLLLYSGYTQSLSSAVSSPDEVDVLTEIVKDSQHHEIIELTNDVTHKVSDFFAITYVQGYIALTWNLGSGTQRIITPSRIDKRLNVHTLFAGRSGRQAWLKVDGMRNVTGKSPGPFHRLNVNTGLFIGGFEAFRFESLPHDLPLHRGFSGCIFDFGIRVKNRLYLPRTLKGRNVKNCYEEDC